MQYPDVTLLITHYNRSSSLEKLLSSISEQRLTFGAIVVSDDASNALHSAHLRELCDIYPIQLVTAAKNGGLGHNINKGQRAVKTPYTLYVQEDFQPTGAFPRAFGDALELMEDDRTLDLVSFYAYKPYPYTRPYRKGYSEKLFKPMPWYANHLKFYVYSDHPHLRRNEFQNKFGAYAEGVNSDRTERLMALSFIKNKGRALVYDNHYGLFVQENTTDEPSTATFRSNWRQSSNWAVKTIRYAYLKWKVIDQTYQLATFKKNTH
ncbi:glycosyltransferase [Parapedobacter sp. ISTM3]|uniref:Glycosyl transferase family 2 n=1 Tax=Parapedobacter luteus TaxID=623280 RepID=A0A1T5C716_9SPHI|nr:MULTISPECIES: glycosyltransferase [Parapedobacter]MBK1439220.1 glycosyltransferase [Parapedobacter sp. ISTM3]SKB54920.1 Glycosyl transferase family 2 [Parapedobacter luteus]